MQCEFNTRQTTMYVELDAVLSVSTLLGVLRPQTMEKHEFELSKLAYYTDPDSDQQVNKYFDPHPFITVASPCPFEYKINTVRGRIPGTLFCYFLVSF